MPRVPCSLAAVLFLAGPALARDALEVHEWGTFRTCLEDENGKSIGGAETRTTSPVPAFVHGLKAPVLLRPIQLPPQWFKGAPACHRT